MFIEKRWTTLLSSVGTAYLLPTCAVSTHIVPTGLSAEGGPYCYKHIVPTGLKSVQHIPNIPKLPMKSQFESLSSLLFITITLLFAGCGQQIVPPVVSPKTIEPDTPSDPRAYIPYTVYQAATCSADDNYSHPLPLPWTRQKPDIIPIWSESRSLISQLNPVPSSELQTLREFDLKMLYPLNSEYKTGKLEYVTHIDRIYPGCHLSLHTTIHSRDRRETYYWDFPYWDFPYVRHPKYNGSCQCYAPLAGDHPALANVLRYPIPGW